MPRARRRKTKLRLGDPPTDRERELWRLQSRNLRARMATDDSAEYIALRLEAIDLGEEAAELRRQRIGR